MKEEELYEQKTPIRLINSCSVQLKPFFYSLKGANSITSKIDEAGLDATTAIIDILSAYIKGNAISIEAKISELEGARDLTNLMILALNKMKRETPPSGDLLKSTKAGRLLYTLKGIEDRSDSACRKMISDLVDRDDHTKLVARGSMKGSHKRFYESDLIEWFEKYSSTYNFQ